MNRPKWWMIVELDENRNVLYAETVWARDAAEAMSEAVATFLKERQAEIAEAIPVDELMALWRR